MTDDAVLARSRDRITCNCPIAMPIAPAGMCPKCGFEGPLHQQALRERAAQGNRAISAIMEMEDVGDCTTREAFAALGGKLAGTELLDSLRSRLLRYVVLPSGEMADAVTLWIAASHAVPAWQHAPRLAVVSPEKRCGKSRLLDVIEATCHAPLLTVNISVAALVRSITSDPPTLLIDEADTRLNPRRSGSDGYEDLRGIINSGHQRNRPYLRWDAAARATENCPTFAFAALAGIGELPETIMDRAVVIRMRRRTAAEKVASYRSRDGAPLRKLGEDIGAWLREHIRKLSAAEPDMPVEDRNADTWEPLIAVADLAGGHWPATARQACITLTSDSTAPVSAGIRLLADIRAVFGNAEKMATADLIGRLCKLDESPWCDWHGHFITPRDLAELLKPYGVRAETIKVDGKTPRGYKRTALHDAWARYLSREGSATCATSATAQMEGTPGVAGCTPQVQPETPDPPLTSEVAQVVQVAGDLQTADLPDLGMLRVEAAHLSEFAGASGT